MSGHEIGGVAGMPWEIGASDEQLAEAYRAAGSVPAVEELMRRHLAAIRGLVYPIVLNDSLADDLTQEILLRAFRGLAAFDGRARFSTWLYRLAMNTVATHFERNGRARVEFRDAMPEPAEPSAARPEQRLLRAELDAEVTTALAALSPKLRAAIVLTCLEHKSPAEAAALEGCSTATMYWRVHEARRLLKRSLGKYLSL